MVLSTLLSVKEISGKTNDNKEEEFETELVFTE